MARWRVDAGGVSASLSVDVEAQLRGAAEALAPGLVADMEASAQELFEGARRVWPVSRRPRTAKHPLHSRDQLEPIVTVTRTELRAGVASGAEYTQYIKSGQNGLSSSQSTYQQAIRTPAQAIAKTLAAKMGARVAGLFADH